MLRGVGSQGTDTLSQTVTVPNTASPKLAFWMLVDSEDADDDAYDTFQVRVKKGTTTTVVLKNSSNQQWDDSYHRKVVDLSAYAGQTVTIQFVGKEDELFQTGFFLDDISLQG